jgi:hypothetical protein
MTMRNFEAVLGGAGYRLCQRAFRAATLTYAGLRLLHKVRLCLPFFDFQKVFRGASGERETEVAGFNPQIRHVGCLSNSGHRRLTCGLPILTLAV